MSRRKDLVGLSYNSSRILQQKDVLRSSLVVVVAENREALGTKLNDFCVYWLWKGVPNEPDDKLIDVVVGDPYLLRNVKVVARGPFESIKIPQAVRKFLSNARNLPTGDIIVFETEDGSLVYAITRYTTLLENVEDMIDSELLEEHLRKA